MSCTSFFEIKRFYYYLQYLLCLNIQDLENQRTRKGQAKDAKCLSVFSLPGTGLINDESHFGGNVFPDNNHLSSLELPPK